MTSRIEWGAPELPDAEWHRGVFERSRPFAGLTIGTGIHLEPKTVALLLTVPRAIDESVARIYVESARS